MWRSARFEVGNKCIIVLPDDGPMQLWSLRVRGNADIKKVVKDVEGFKLQKQFITMAALGFENNTQGYRKMCENAYVDVIIRNSRIVRMAVNGLNAASLTIAQESNTVVVWEEWTGELYEVRKRREKGTDAHNIQGGKSAPRGNAGGDVSGDMEAHALLR